MRRSSTACSESVSIAATPGGVLADQAWIHDASKSVAQALDEAKASVVRFARVSVSGS